MGARSSICARWWGGSFKRPTPEHYGTSPIEPLAYLPLRVEPFDEVFRRNWIEPLQHWFLTGRWPDEPEPRALPPVGLLGPLP